MSQINELLSFTKMTGRSRIYNNLQKPQGPKDWVEWLKMTREISKETKNSVRAENLIYRESV
jgi:hypothetical protein